MKPGTSRKQSCGPQLLTAGEPSHSWGVKELGQYCQVQHEAIVSGEKELTPAYWRLGMALNLARKHFTQGQWTKYLDSLGIEKTRASKARAIFRTFSTADQTAGLSVEEAYGKRHRNHQRRGRATSGSQSNKPPCDTSLDHVCGELECLIDQARSVTPDEARELLQATQGLIRRLQELERYLQQRAEESDRDFLPMTRE
jgi:hypothetical protein